MTSDGCDFARFEKAVGQAKNEPSTALTKRTTGALGRALAQLCELERKHSELEVESCLEGPSCTEGGAEEEAETTENALDTKRALLQVPQTLLCH